MAEQECHEEVSRRGELQPCNRVAVAMRIDPTFGDPYPVCAFHARGSNMMSLSAVEASVRADVQREIRTVEELDALPVGSVLQILGGEDHPIAAMKNTTYNWPGPNGAAWWVTGFSDDDGYSAHCLLDLYDGAQITILFTPSTPNQQGAES